MVQRPAPEPANRRPCSGSLRIRVLCATILPTLLGLLGGGLAILASLHGRGEGRTSVWPWIAWLAASAGGVGLAIWSGQRLASHLRRSIDHLVARIEQVASLEAPSPGAQRAGDEFLDVTHRLDEMRRSIAQRFEVLADLDQMKSDFLGLASHELRTPVAILQGCVDLLSAAPPRELSPGAEGHGILQGLERATESLSRVVGQVTDMALLDRRTMTQAMRAVPMDDLARSAVDGLRPALATRDLTLTLELGSDGPAVLGDASRLEQAVDHLLRNAIRYTPDGGRIVLRTRVSGSEVLCEVEDSGIGIPEEVKERIFDALYEAKSHLHHRSGTVEFGSSGLGLGLAICQKIVRAHRGRIEVESTPGQGSLFRVALPVLVPAPAPAPAELRAA